MAIRSVSFSLENLQYIAEHNFPSHDLTERSFNVINSFWDHHPAVPDMPEVPPQLASDPSSAAQKFLAQLRLTDEAYQVFEKQRALAKAMQQRQAYHVKVEEECAAAFDKAAQEIGDESRAYYFERHATNAQHDAELLNNAIRKEVDYRQIGRALVLAARIQGITLNSKAMEEIKEQLARNNEFLEKITQMVLVADVKGIISLFHMPNVAAALSVGMMSAGQGTASLNISAPNAANFHPAVSLAANPYKAVNPVANTFLKKI